MKVTLSAPWFAPSETIFPDKLREFSGRFYDKGVHYFPNTMLKLLPKSALVEDGPVEDQSIPAHAEWRLSADQARAAAESLGAIHAEADEKLKNKRAAIAKAREAKLAKKMERDAAEAE